MRLAAVMTLLCGCGPAPVLYVEVLAPFHVPDACDSLHVAITRAADGGSVFDQTYPLTQQFPTEQLFDADAVEENVPLAVTVTALSSQADAGSAALPVTLHAGELTRLSFQLSRP